MLICVHVGENLLMEEYYLGLTCVVTLSFRFIFSQSVLDLVL